MTWLVRGKDAREIFPADSDEKVVFIIAHQHVEFLMIFFYQTRFLNQRVYARFAFLPIQARYFRNQRRNLGMLFFCSCEILSDPRAQIVRFADINNLSFLVFKKIHARFAGEFSQPLFYSLICAIHLEKLIKIENLSVVYDVGKANETKALADINVEIYPDEYIVFFGPSGCGKSTLLYVIAGMQGPTSGRLIIGGKEMSKASKKDLARYHQTGMGLVREIFFARF